MRSKRAFYNIFSSLILQIVTIIYGFIIPKIIISFYGSNVNGLISSVTQLLAYISLLDSGFTAVIKAELYKPIVEHNDNNINKILKSAETFFKRIAYIFVIYIIVLSLIYQFIVSTSFDYWSTSLLIIIL